MKVTNDILSAWATALEKRKLHPSHSTELKKRTCKLIAQLKLDYCYDGLDFYMNEENFRKILTSIEAYCDYKENPQDYLTSVELRSYLSDKYVGMPRNTFNFWRTPYDVPTEDYKTTLEIESQLESIGIKPITTVNCSVIFKKSDIDIAKNKLVSLNDIQNILEEEHKLKISRKALYKIINSEDYDAKYHLNSFRMKCLNNSKIVFKKDILDIMKIILENRITDAQNYYNRVECAKKLGVTVEAITRCINLNLISTEMHINGMKKIYRIPASEVERWLLFKSTHTALSEFLDTELKKMGRNFNDGIIRHKRYVVSTLKNNKNFFGCKVIPVIDTPFHKEALHYISNNDLDYMRKKFNEYINELEYNSLSRDEQFEYSLRFIDDKFKNTKEDIENLVSDNLNTKEAFGWLDCIRVLGQILEKELYLYSNKEAQELISKVNPLVKSKVAKKFLLRLLNYTKDNNDCNFDHHFVFEDNNIVPSDTTPYTMEQMGRLAILVFNETHPSFKKRLKDAIRNRGNAGAWLYVALHYVCSWRRSDMTHTLPRITLPTKDYNEYFNLLKKEGINDDMAHSITKELEDMVSVLNLQPKKTEERTNQELILDIPEGARRIIGTLLGLCEAHVQKYEHENPGETINYIPENSKTAAPFIRLFGDEYIDIFGKSIFNNIKANRFYLINIVEIAENEGIGTGYIIASLARAHKFTLDEKSNTTQIYLRYFKDLTDNDILLRELFERGVCSFMPYLALKMASGEENIKSLSLNEQTNLIKKLPEPIVIEDSLKELSDVLDICKDNLNKLIQIFGEKDNINWNDEVKTFVTNLAGKGSNGKTKGTKCILRALGKECNNMYRDNCIGCGEEIYLKSTFQALGEKVRFFREKMISAQTKASAAKYKFILEKVMNPIVKNIRVCLKEIYGVNDMYTFKLIYDGKYIGEENVT